MEEARITVVERNRPDDTFGFGVVFSDQTLSGIKASDRSAFDDMGKSFAYWDDIDIVVCSHLHPDHCGCNAFFKRATFAIHAKEVEAARAPGAEKSGYLATEWEQRQRA